MAFRAGNDSELEPATYNQINGRLPKWPTGTDCKSVGKSLRRFESFTAHSLASRHVGTYTYALIAQTVEHVLGKNGVMGSNPIEGSIAG